MKKIVGVTLLALSSTLAAKESKFTINNKIMPAQSINAALYKVVASADPAHPTTDKEPVKGTKKIEIAASSNGTIQLPDDFEQGSYILDVSWGTGEGTVVLTCPVPVATPEEIHDRTFDATTGSLMLAPPAQPNQGPSSGPSDQGISQPPH